MSDQELKIVAPAKVNLTLQVVGRLKNGLHRLRSFIAPISLSDEVALELTDDGRISLECEFDEVLEAHLGGRGDFSAIRASLDSPENLAWRSAELFFRSLEAGANPRRQGVHLKVRKSIPLGAGLGGGSGDAAGVLLALNHLFHAPFPLEKLAELAREVGTDVAPMVLGQARGGLVFQYGTGQKLIPVLGGELLEGCGLVVVQGVEGVDTKQAYLRLGFAAEEPQETAEGERPWEEPAVVEFCGAIGGSFPGGLLTTAVGGDNSRGPALERVFRLFSNEFEQVAFELCPGVRSVSEVLVRAGADRVMLTGSGSAVVGYCLSESKAQQVAERVRQLMPEPWFVSVAKILFSSCGVLKRESQ